MKTLTLIPLIFLITSFTHPFAQEGSVDTDRELIEERIEKAKQNELQEERAEEVVKKEEKTDKELERKLRPNNLFHDREEK